MAGLSVERLVKLFGAHRALDDVSLEVRDGEFIAVLGPSGCGKTTLLRLIAGFDAPDDGAIAIDGRVMSSAAVRVPPEERRIGIVFQNYALWPHMSVRENVAYALKIARVPEPDLTRRVDAALDLVGLTGFGERRPAALSGGQRQRVALARCLVAEPSLVLLDEPLANLDVHLRAAMEEEFSRFHARTGRTMIYITHDQAEAMALADRIAVMDNGRLLQLASPSQLYREPADATVARFIGQGMVLPVERVARDGEGRARGQVFGAAITARCGRENAPAASAQICVRPRDIAIAAGDDGFAATVSHLVYQGGRYRVEARPDADPSLALRLDVDEPTTLSAGQAIRLRLGDGWILPG
ncbi:MAG: spermidine/putrescine ABC transporter ATP-binding protein [Rhizobiales bacterium 65-9]|nr:ABC transporter ATP-binding protein [Hyphomicrobiales bacterium]OJY34997.1 MAG: spermidine/putrescine ABC transporter ATP-binding protein [Rhizobiales bacterium 65-9]